MDNDSDFDSDSCILMLSCSLLLCREVQGRRSIILSYERICLQVRSRAVEAGALKALETGMLSGEREMSLHCLRAIFSAATDPFPFFVVLIAR
jgi:hypothetical protein